MGKVSNFAFPRDSWRTATTTRKSCKVGSMLLVRTAASPAWRSVTTRRYVSSLSQNPHIKVFPTPGGHLLTYLETNPPNAKLAIGTTTELPATPRSFRENPAFMPMLNEVLSKYAAQDPGLKAQAQAFASPGGMTFGAGGGAFSQQRRRATKSGDSGSGASGQGGAGGGGVGGHVHLSDLRNPPDYGRIAWPEDIFGSIEVNGRGELVGEFEPSGTYRILTNEGM
ncbi:uncharacterized protein B0I36DRAFT_329223 [Microdochium trichocladiopsis]|uniref:Uncharacterized protein n=1 Tax=Microdochium trichocladiopsis TaxID=1682393 RepID=A0A9P8XY72_9PEZI|nr:uncharacterized protein B0I36DRAFT_329223 [Microdochium trichocladiopsis]KAH7025830.1 hypothetical protein B0I36DRAFT_329223 [Microdochium trichocladiopsis]